MFTIDSPDIKRLEADLKAFAHKALPFATRNTVNRAAFQARREWQHQIDEKLVQRNKFTRNSIQVDLSRTLNVRQQAATVGSVAPYMENSEFGGIKEDPAIQTGYSAGQRGQQPRTRLPRRKNALKNIQLRKRRRKAKTRKQAMVFKVQDAVSSGRRFVFLDLGRTQGIFKVVGGRGETKRGWPKGAKLRMVADLSRKAVVVPPTPTLGPAVVATQKAIPLLYKAALTEQLRRHRLFRDR